MGDVPEQDGMLLPTGTRLLHIGPHKTGTTAVQSAFHRDRRGLATQGVHYAGSQRQPMQAVHAITGRPSPYADGRTPPMSRWRGLVNEVRRASEPRVVISSEGFADASDDAVRQVVEDLDGDRLHVVVTLRPLADLLPSQWQQQVQTGLTLAYQEWLEAIFNAPDHRVSRTFWHRHRHDELIGRWASQVGAENLTAIVADASDRDSTLRVFEAMVGLRAGTLVPDPDLANRSLTFAEVETVRAFNVAFRAEGLGTQLHAKVMRFGAAELLKRREPRDDDARIETPGWALDRAAGVAREIVEGIRASGVRVIGDLDALAPPAPKAQSVRAGSDSTPDISIATWADVGATSAIGILLAAGLARGAGSRPGSEAAWPDGPPDRTSPPPRARVEPLELARVSTPLLGLVLVRRLIGAGIAKLPLPRRGS